MRVLVSGAGGFIGTPLVRSLEERGDEVVRLTRGEAGNGRVHWDPSAGKLESSEIEGVDAVIHLAGEPIAGLWTDKKKRAIIESRRKGTRLLAAGVAAPDRRPGVFVSSSAIGIYGSRGDEILEEDAGVGEGFLAEVVSEWEGAAAPAREAGIRTVYLRLGLVTAERGGMMVPMRPVFKLGIGGRLGGGGQWWSWVTLDDVVRAFIYAIDRPEMSGPYNVTAPTPATNAEFTRELAHAMHRPAFMAVPKFAIKLLAGEMADEMLLSSARTDSSRIAAAGFEFADPELAPALERLFS